MSTGESVHNYQSRVHFLQDIEQLQQAVSVNPMDFASWTKLLAAAEASGDLSSIRSHFDSFLGQFPFCYGYWKKYADAEYKPANAELTSVQDKMTALQSAISVYERACVCVSHSAELWLHYCNFLVQNGTDLDTTRSTFERAVCTATTDPKAGKIWSAYIAFETSQGQERAAGILFSRLFAFPAAFLEGMWKEFEEWVEKRTAKAVAVTDEELQKAAQLSGTSVSADAPPEVDNAVKAQLVSQRKETYTAALAAYEPRREFEDKIKRAFFHVKPLPESQLENWRKYLQYSIDNASISETMKLFERCIVVCANYAEFWLQYAYWIRNVSEEDAAAQLPGYPVGAAGAVSVLLRPQSVHLPSRPDIWLALARAYEEMGDVDNARNLYSQLTSSVGNGMAEVTVEAAHFERRQGNKDAAVMWFDHALKDASTSMKPLLTIQLSRLLSQCGQHDRAVEVCQTARQSAPEDVAMCRAALQSVEARAKATGSDVAAALSECYFDILKVPDVTKPSDARLAEEDGEELWAECIDVLRTEGSSIKAVVDAMAKKQEWNRVYRNLRAAGDASKKRSAADAGQGATNGASKQQKVTATSTSAAVDPAYAAYYAAQAGTSGAATDTATAAAYAQYYAQYAQYPGAYGYPATGST